MGHGFRDWDFGVKTRLGRLRAQVPGGLGFGSRTGSATAFNRGLLVAMPARIHSRWWH